MKTPRRTNTNPSDADRFIPNRSSMNIDLAKYDLTCENSEPPASPSAQKYNESLRSQLFERSAGSGSSSKILSFKNKAPAPPPSYQNSMRVLYSERMQGGAAAPTPARHLPSVADLALDLPDIMDDYYINILAWSSENIVAIALGRACYLYNATSGSTTLLTELRHESALITSVKWMDGHILVIGTTDGTVQLWDVSKNKKLRTMSSAAGRVGSLATHKHILSAGSADSNIHNHDVRIKSHRVSTFGGHGEEVCGLTWSPDGTYLASGSNDNLLKIWDAKSLSSTSAESLHTMTAHTAAVKALAWCPWQRNLLASGGGTADQTIRFWNAGTGEALQSVHTGSQVCALLWSPHHRELVSSHGFAQNQLTVWKYPSLVRVGELTGHTSRVLFMALSPDGETVASAAGDETLRFWKIWEPSARSASSGSSHGTASKSHMGLGHGNHRRGIR